MRKEVVLSRESGEDSNFSRVNLCKKISASSRFDTLKVLFQERPYLRGRREGANEDCHTFCPSTVGKEESRHHHHEPSAEEASVFSGIAR